MKKSIYKAIAVSTGLLLSTSALAEVTGNIGATSNYLWRGTTQTSGEVAVQGGLDYADDSGFYVGTWASNVDFGDGTSYEIDFFGGYAGEINKDISYDVSYFYYAYPDAASDINFGEVTLSLAWNGFDVGYSKALHADSDVSGASSETDWNYIQANYSYDLTDKLALSFHYGRSFGDVVEDLLGEDYSDYNVTLSATVPVGAVTFMVSDTDLKDDDVKVAIGYTYSFDL